MTDYQYWDLRWSDQKKESIVSVKRCSKDPNIVSIITISIFGPLLQRLVHMDVLLEIG